MNQLNIMLVIKFKLEGGILIERSINTDKIGEWINSHQIEERLQLFNSISVEPENKEEAKKVLMSVATNLLSEDLSESELFILLTAFDSLTKKIKKKLNKLKN